MAVQPQSNRDYVLKPKPKGDIEYCRKDTTDTVFSKNTGRARGAAINARLRYTYKHFDLLCLRFCSTSSSLGVSLLLLFYCSFLSSPHVSISFHQRYAWLLLFRTYSLFILRESSGCTEC